MKIYNINIFDGRKDIIKPEMISGAEGSITLGTNFCGPGTNIRVKRKPLHVIISCFTSNTRVLNQGYEQTGRKGQQGTVRIIFIKKQFLQSQFDNSDNRYNDSMKIFKYKKKKKQFEFIEHFKKNRPWIFLPQEISDPPISN